jgi:hypothetical protein
MTDLYELGDNVDEDGGAPVAAGVAAAAAFASLSTLSASLMCRGDRLGMLRNWESVDELRLGGFDHDAEEKNEYGDSFERELLREGMDSG